MFKNILIVFMCLFSFASANSIYLPVLGSSPEKGFTYGVASMFFEPIPNSNKTNVIQIGYIGSDKDQTITFLNWEQYLNNTNQRLDFKLAYLDSAYLFWGIGTDTIAANEESYLFTDLKLDLSYSTKLNEEIFIGPALSISNYKLNDYVTSGVLASTSTPGKLENNVLGLGLEIIYDTRNNTFYPSRGNYLKFKPLFYSTELGSDFNFSRLELDYRHFISINNNVLATQIYALNNTGDTPFQMLSKMGGDTLRGLYEGRYVDNAYIAVQSEYRHQFNSKFGAVVFGGYGQVGNSINKIDFSHAKGAYGFGFRYGLTNKENINLRIDFAYWDEDSGMYINFREAF